MIAIAYPVDKNKRDLLKNKYYKTIVSLVDLIEINRQLNLIPYNGSTLDFKKIAIAEFDELIIISQLIDNHLAPMTNVQKTNFNKLFYYKKLQPFIANFFIEH